MEDCRLILGRCEEVLPTLEAGSIDLVLADPPYGTTACAWDSVIPLEPMWREVRRVLKPAGAAVFTASQPFTSALVMSNLGWFKYELIWEKSAATGFLDCRFRPLKAHENVLVFSAAGCSNGSKLPMRYDPQCVPGEPYSGRGRGAMGPSASRSRTVRLPGSYDGLRWPRSVLYFASDRNGLHETAKPVALMEYLVRTYSDPGGTVLDFCMGSGTTGVAALKTGRRFVGIEKEPQYVEIAQKRLAEAQGPLFAAANHSQQNGG